MPYGGDPQNDQADELRFYVGDTADPPVLSDDEVDYLLSIAPSVREAARLAALRISVRFGGLADKTVGDLSISYQARSDRYSSIANSMASGSPPIPTGSYAREEGDFERLFELGMHDHPDAKLKKPTAQ